MLGKVTKSLLSLLLILAVASLCFAENYYAMISHKSENNNYLIRLIKCSDEQICKQILKIKSVDLNSNWKYYEGECLLGSQYDSMYQAVFNKQFISEPYIYYIDENNLPTVLKFMDITPFLANVMIDKWAKALRGQGMKELVVIKAK